MSYSGYGTLSSDTDSTVVLPPIKNRIPRYGIDAQQYRKNEAEIEAHKSTKAKNILKAILTCILCCTIIVLVVFLAFKLNKTIDNANEGISEARVELNKINDTVEGLRNKEKTGTLDKIDQAVDSFNGTDKEKGIKNGITETLDNINRVINTITGQPS